MKIKLTITFVVAMLFLVNTTTKAQSSGLTIGANVSNLYVDNVDDENAKIGLNIGFYNQVKFNDLLGLQYEFAYSQKGAALQYDNFLSGSGTYRFNLNYIKVPLMLNVKLGPIAFQGGAYTAFLIGANIKDVNSDGSINSIRDLDRDDFNTIDYGAVGGITHDFTGGHFGLRYNYGFREIGRSGSFAGQATENSKNSALLIYFGFDF